ncbi:hypothetical protein [Bacillus toyonensis]|nr:hypothetical protein [Bacillus toyonensis]
MANKLKKFFLNFTLKITYLLQVTFLFEDPFGAKMEKYFWNLANSLKE